MTQGLTFTKTITMITEICCNCGVAFAMPSDLQEIFLNNPTKSFYCPNGHGQHYRDSKEGKLRREAEQKLMETQRLLEQKKNELADSDQIKAIMQKQLDRSIRKLKRIENGVCPDCNRHFTNLERHIKTKHYKAAGCSAKKH